MRALFIGVVTALGLVLSATYLLARALSIAQQGPGPAAPAPLSPDDQQRRLAQDIASLNVWQRGVYEQGLQMGKTHEQAMEWARSQYVGGWNVDGP